MREEMRPLVGKRLRAWGTVVRYGSKASFRGPPKVTLLLRDVEWKGGTLCDHLWFTVGTRMAVLDLRPGDVVEFDARVGRYMKGYRGRGHDDAPQLDYKLSHPTRVTLRTRAAHDAFQAVLPSEGSANHVVEPCAACGRVVVRRTTPKRVRQFKKRRAAGKKFYCSERCAIEAGVVAPSQHFQAWGTLLGEDTGNDVEDARSNEEDTGVQA